MRRYPADPGLAVRMLIVLALLFLLYLGFFVVMVEAGLDPLFALLIAGFGLGLQYFFSDRLALLAVGAKMVDPARYPELDGMLTRLCLAADLPKPKLAIADLDVPNAFAAGRDPNHSVVVLTRALLERLEPEEVEAVIAHELSHIRNRDVLVITLATFFSLVAYYIVRFGPYVMGGRRRRDSGNVFLALLAALAVWLISMLLIRALSRYREYAADRGSAYLTGRPMALASALVKISEEAVRLPKEDLRTMSALNALFIFPFRGGGLFELFSTHPSLEKRLRYLEKVARELERP
ncbi:MAG: zinc metalloprotease HtpX [Chloroflexota bacterium]